MSAKKSWCDRLADETPHVVKPAPIDIAGMKKGEIMLVPTERLVDDFIKAIPHGHSVDVKSMRRELARRHGAEVTCPITTGYHLRTVAEAACERLEEGASADEVTPFWRVLDAKTPTTKKVACGEAFVAEQRAREGLAL
jgi:hypothetical protein